MRLYFYIILHESLEAIFIYTTCKQTVSFTTDNVTSIETGTKPIYVLSNCKTNRCPPGVINIAVYKYI